MKDLKKYIMSIPDFPEKGIIFRDVTSLLQDSNGLSEAIDEMLKQVEDIEFDAVAGLESRGFLFGAPIAYMRKKGLITVRKKGKLPGETVCQSYALEYGEATIEVHKADVNEGDKFLIVDDLIATGGTLDATRKLLEKLGAVPTDVFGVIGLPALKYEEALKPMTVTTLINFEGE